MKYNNCKRLLWTTKWQQKTQHKRNGQIVRNIQSPKTEPEDIENMNRQIISNEIESVIYKLPKNKILGLDDFTGKFYQTCREELTPSLLKLLKNIAEEGTLVNPFYEASITPIPKPDKNITKKENYRVISLMNIDEKNSQLNTNKLKTTIH